MAILNISRSEIPAVTHVDGSARFQTINERTNPNYYRLLKAFYKLTGVPVLLNTSINGNGDPILETPEEAIKLGSNYLVIGRPITKSKNPLKTLKEINKTLS